MKWTKDAKVERRRNAEDGIFEAAIFHFKSSGGYGFSIWIHPTTIDDMATLTNNDCRSFEAAAQQVEAVIAEIRGTKTPGPRARTGGKG